MKNESKPDPDDELTVGINVGDTVYRRVKNRYLLETGKRGEAQSWNQWLVRLLSRKLEKEFSPDTSKLNRDRWLTIRIDTKLMKQIDKQVAILKRLHHSYSRRRWLREALEEALIEEEKNARKLFDDMHRGLEDQ